MDVSRSVCRCVFYGQIAGDDIMTPGDRRILLGGATIVSAIFVIGRGLPRVQDWMDQRVESAARATNEASVLRQMSVNAGAWDDSIKGMRGRLASLDDWWLRAPSLALARIALTRHLSDAAEAAGVELATQPERSDTTTRIAARLRVRVSATGTPGSLVWFLAMLEGGPPRLLVKQFSMVRNENTQAVGAGERSRMDLVVEALAQIDTLQGAR